MLHFLTDDVVGELEPTRSVEDLVKLLFLLCGRDLHDVGSERTEATARRLRESLGKTPSDILPASNELSYEQLNELLLLIGENRISKAYYRFFVLGETDSSDASGRLAQVTIDDLISATIRFRGLAMLGFGNFRYPYAQLRDADDLESTDAFEDLAEWVRESDALIEELKDRPPALAPITDDGTRIPREKTHYIGYLMDDALQNDRALVEVISGKAGGEEEDELLRKLHEKGEEDLADRVGNVWPPDPRIVKEFGDRTDELRKEANQLNANLRQTRRRGEENTDRYLTWDYMDVYVATSMRNQWEFRDTDRVIQDLFHHDKLEDLKLRWFNPTQCYEGSIIDKGLLEALMLKRAKCTVYMAQESDTFGKDSELAATLAQGKPVVAYVPSIRSEPELREFGEKVTDRSLDYFQRRINFLVSDGFFRDDSALLKVVERLDEIPDAQIEDEREVLDVARRMQRKLMEVEDGRAFQVLGDQNVHQEEFLKHFECPGLFMAAVESVAFDNRARMISKNHPLALQVHLESGVANGVLVARTVGEMAEVLRGLLTNSLKFRIKSLEADQLWLGTVLEEAATGSKFRAVTSNKLLGNSFWNFYLSGR